MKQATTNPTSLPSRVYQKNGAYYYVDRNRKWIRLGKTIEEALVAYKQVTSSKSPRSVEAGFVWYFNNIAPRLSPRTQSDYKLDSEVILAAFGNMDLDALTTNHINQYMENRALAPVRANRERALLSTMYNSLIGRSTKRGQQAVIADRRQWSFIKTNPVEGSIKFEETGRDRYVEDHEYEAVWNLANQNVRDFMVFGYCTSQRIGDLIDIRLTDIRDINIFFDQNKMKRRGRSRLLIAMSDEMMEIVERRSKTAKVFLFETRSHTQYTYDGISSQFKRTVAKAVKEGLISESFTFHDLRGKALTDADAAGMSAQKLAGHRSAAQTEHYIKRKRIQKVTSMSITAIRKGGA